MMVVTLSSEDPMSAEREDHSLAGLARGLSLAALLIGAASPLLGQNPAPPAPDLSLGSAILANPPKILTSYSGQIYYKGEGYDVTATVTKGMVVCQGTFRTSAGVSPIQGKGKLDLEMNINSAHEYQFTLHCPFPQSYGDKGASLEELAHSYKRPGGAVEFDPATCGPLGRPKPGGSGPCTVVWPEILSGQWSDTTGEAVLFLSWALCQKQCPTPPAPPAEGSDSGSTTR
jgi:hypothetical protein